MSEQFIHITRWQDFQHDKRRKGAPWHKEHAAQIDNDTYLDLSLAARGLLLGLRLMYGRRHPEGVSVGNARRLLTTTANDTKHFGTHLEALNRAGFITISASSVLATRAQGASTLLAQEVEVEEEKDKPRAVPVLRSVTAQDHERGETNAVEPERHPEPDPADPNGSHPGESEVLGTIADGVRLELARAGEAWMR